MSVVCIFAYQSSSTISNPSCFFKKKEYQDKQPEMEAEQTLRRSFSKRETSRMFRVARKQKTRDQKLSKGKHFFLVIASYLFLKKFVISMPCLVCLFSNGSTQTPSFPIGFKSKKKNVARHFSLGIASNVDPIRLLSTRIAAPSETANSVIEPFLSTFILSLAFLCVCVCVLARNQCSQRERHSDDVGIGGNLAYDDRTVSTRLAVLILTSFSLSLAFSLYFLAILIAPAARSSSSL